MQNDQSQNQKHIFSNTGEIHTYQEQNDALIVTALLCKVGNFTDANGTSVNLTKESLRNLADAYNLEVEAEYNKIKANKKEPIGRIFLEKLLRKKTPELSLDEITLAPVTTEHTLHNSFIVGRVLGRLEFKDISETYGEICCRLFITTKEYVDKVKGGILNQISMSYYPATNKLEEISFTIYGAIDGAQIIRMSQNGIQPDKAILVKTIGGLSKKLTAINNELDSTNTKLSEIRNKRDTERSVLGLISSGKIYPRDREILINNLLQMSTDHDRNLLLRTIRRLPSSIDIRIHNKNNLAFRMEELAMSQDKTALVQTAEEISAAVKENLKQENNSGQPTQIAPVVNFSANPADNGFSSEHAILLSNMLKSGKSDEALNYLHKFTQEKQAQELQQEAINEATAVINDKPKEEAQLEEVKVQKEEIKLSLLNQISKLTDILQKMP